MTGAVFVAEAKSVWRFTRRVLVGSVYGLLFMQRTTAPAVPRNPRRFSVSRFRSTSLDFPFVESGAEVFRQLDFQTQGFGGDGVETDAHRIAFTNGVL